MDVIESSITEDSLPPSKHDDVVEICSMNSFESLPDDTSKQGVINLTPELRIPSTPARQTSEFFDRINNLDPVKYSPPDPNPLPRMSKMSEQ
jgi:hypothetical protein